MPDHKKIRLGLLAVSFSSLFLLTSCGQFFIPQNGGGGATCTDCVYIANSGTNDVAQFAVGSKLTVVASTNVSVGDVPSSIAVSPKGPYVYVGTVNSGIFLLTIQSGGALSTSTSASTSVGPYAMAVDATGAWLITASLDTSASTCTIQGTSGTGYPYKITSFSIGTAGAITLEQSLDVYCGSTTAPPTDLVISADDNYIFVTAGGVGMAGIVFDSGSGAMTSYASISLALNSAVTSYNGVAIDPSSKYIFLSSSGTGGGLTEYALPTTLPTQQNPDQPLTKVGSTQSPIDSFYAVAAPGSGSYVYVSDRLTGNIYGYQYGSSTLAVISGSPFAPSAASNGTIGMAVDDSSTYLLTINSSSGPNIQAFSIGSTGALTASSTGTTSSGSYYPIGLAVTGSGS
jgi:hypothetical protein